MVIALSSAFKTEPELVSWIERSSLLAKWLEEEKSFVVIEKSKLVKFNNLTRRRKFLDAYTASFPCEEPPISAEFDFIFIPMIYGPQRGNDETSRFFNHPGEFLPGAAEIKYFRKGVDGKINLPYYAGLDQALAYLKFGFYRIYLWHFFDHEIPEKTARRYINHVIDLLDHLKLPVPLMYDYYLIKQGDEKTEFDIHKLEQGYRSSDPNWVNPYYNEERAAIIRQLILDEMGTSFLQL